MHGNSTSSTYAVVAEANGYTKDPGEHVVWGNITSSSDSASNSASWSDSAKQFEEQQEKDSEVSKTIKRTDDVVVLTASDSSDNDEVAFERIHLASQESPHLPEELQRLRKLPLKELLKVLPLDENGQQTSIGQLLHAEGTCVPCGFIRKSRGCNQNAYCGFCHSLDHAKRKKHRPCKGQRQRFQNIIAKAKAMMDSNGGAFDPAAFGLPPSIENNTERKHALVKNLLEYKKNKHGVAGEEGLTENALDSTEYTENKNRVSDDDESEGEHCEISFHGGRLQCQFDLPQQQYHYPKLSL